MEPTSPPAQIPVDSFEQAFWLEPFREAGKLADARRRILERVGAGDLSALALMLALGQLKLASSAVRMSQDHLVEALDHLGATAYRFWKTEPGLSVETIFETAQSWGTELNRLLAACRTPFALSIRIIMPKSGFDMTTMLSERSITGATSKVREPLSWIVIGRSGEQLNILAVGKVVTE